MTPIRSQPIPPAGPGGHADWRRRRLIVAGVDGPLAARLAADAGVDLHELLTLLDAGCPPVLAARIVAPIDRPAP